MQAIHRFNLNYVKPIRENRWFQFASFAVVEIVKIIAAKTFLEYLGKQFLSHSTKVSKREIYNTIILPPVFEEIFFRFVVLQGIHLTQKILNSATRIELSSNIYGSSKQNLQSNKLIININPPLMEEVLCRGYVKATYFMTEWAKFIFCRTNAYSKDVQKKQMTEEEKRDQIQQVFRIHLSALIFAAAHLSNPHPNKTSALIQFTWTYIGGIIYGYMCEKYHSLAPGILAHGFNNGLALARKAYSPLIAPYLLLGQLVSRISFYILSVTSFEGTLLPNKCKG